MATEGSTDGSAGQEARAVRRTRAWLERVVIAANLCPFAARALRRDEVRIVAASLDVEACLQRLAAEAAALAGAPASDAGDAPTVLLTLVPDADGATPVDELDDFLDLVALAEDLLDALGHAGTLQLASFHPRYAFEGELADDPANATNRAPYPTLHLLRESAVAAGTDRHPDPDGIPGRNIGYLRTLGADGVRRLLDRIDAPDAQEDR